MQTAHQFMFDDGIPMPYLLYVPEEYERDTERLWPLVLFLHGSGERGHDVELVRKFGVPHLVDTEPNFPAIVLSPQCPLDERWPQQSDRLLEMLDSVLPTLRVDLSRVYLTGLSMGGQGAWHLGTLDPKRFAAVLPICGRIPADEGFPENVSRLKDVPMWVFHGAKDDRVPVEHSLTMVKILEDCGGTVRLTIFPDGDHFCWDAVYADPAVWEWLLRQKKS